MSKSRIQIVSPKVLTVSFITFSGGEEHVQIHSREPSAAPPTTIDIEADIWDSSGIMRLAMLKGALDVRFTGTPVRLRMEYLPYARQERVCAPGQAPGLSVFARMLYSMGFQAISISTPHTNSIQGMMPGIEVREFPYAEGLLGHYKDFVVVAPDAGASKRAQEFADRFKVPMIQALKTRVPETGALTDCRVFSEHLGDKNLLIVDDICDGGRTFLNLQKKLKEVTNGKISLYVAHGIFSAGFDALELAFDRVYCENTPLDPTNLPGFVKTPFIK